MAETSLDPREMCLANELELSINFLKKGLADLQRINQGNDFCEAPIYYLSFGLEKLLKCAIVLAKWDDSEELRRLHKNWRKGKGHNLEILQTDLLNIVENNNYSLDGDARKKDIAFIRNNSELKEIVTVLSKYSQGGRYYNLDIIMREDLNTSNPKAGWDEILDKIFLRRKDLMINTYNDRAFDHIPEIINEVVVIIEKLLRAISRFFTLGGLGTVDKKITRHVKDFASLNDREIGNRNYNDFQRHPKESLFLI